MYEDMSTKRIFSGLNVDIEVIIFDEDPRSYLIVTLFGRRRSDCMREIGRVVVLVVLVFPSPFQIVIRQCSRDIVPHKNSFCRFPRPENLSSQFCRNLRSSRNINDHGKSSSPS